VPLHVTALLSRIVLELPAQVVEGITKCHIGVRMRPFRLVVAGGEQLAAGNRQVDADGEWTALVAMADSTFKSPALAVLAAESCLNSPLPAPAAAPDLLLWI
jgi:hypothetical protein